MKYIIIENEYYALKNLKEIISVLRPDHTMIFSCESIEESIIYLQNHPTDADLIFMDIELVDGNCFEIFEKIKVEIPVIFCTAYNQFAVDAFKYYSINYLLKPLFEEQVAQALEKFEKFYQEKKGNINIPELKDIFAPKNHKKRFLISKGDDYTYVDTNKIAYFTSEDKYIFITTLSGNRGLTNYLNLNQVEEVIDPGLFFRVSRQMVINITLITKVTKYFNGRLKIYYKDNFDKSIEIIVSSARKDDFLAWMDGGLK